MKQSVESALEAADIAQHTWAQEVPRQRLQVIGKLSGILATRYAEFLPAIERSNATAAEKLSSEILPLADACRFTARVGRQTLADRTLSARYGAWWLGRVGVRITREPWGTILVIGPSNYPLFLPGVQIIQALAAGNAVVVKPAPGGAAVMELLKQCLVEAGMPDGLLQVLPTDVETAVATIQQGVDKVVLTGSLQTGRAVLRQLAETLTPATMELSGCDAVFVLPQDDMRQAARVIGFALKLNGGATCIAPRRIFVMRDSANQLIELLRQELESVAAPMHVASGALTLTHQTVQQALAAGAEVCIGELPYVNTGIMKPLVLRGVTMEMEIARSDLFAPVASVIEVDSMEEAIVADRSCPYGLGAAVFGPTTNAKHVASKISAGCVVLNDMIAPTADPRVAFGGRNQSGWGVTRGAEGLLEMTRIKTVCIRRGKWLPHLNPQDAQDVYMLERLLQLFHASTLRARLTALLEIIQYARRKK
jgi:acyl-CoA reductase-like NAD-dependent aldehyde dehydrogenase